MIDCLKDITESGVCKITEYPYILQGSVVIVSDNGKKARCPNWGKGMEVIKFACNCIYVKATQSGKVDIYITNRAHWLNIWLTRRKSACFRLVMKMILPRGRRKNGLIIFRKSFWLAVSHLILTGCRLVKTKMCIAAGLTGKTSEMTEFASR